MLSSLIHCLLVYSVFAQDAINITTNSTEENKNETTYLPVNSTETPVTTTVKPEENNYQYIVKLEYNFREEKIPEFLSGIVARGIADTKITISDLINVSGVQKYNLNDTLALLDMMGIPFERAFSVDTLEIVLNNLQVPFPNFYVALNQSLGLAPAAISQIIRDLRIESGKFTLAMVLGEYNIYDVLRNGTFTKDTLQQASQTAQIPLPEIFQAIKNVLLENLRKLDRKDFDNLLQENGVSQRTIFLLWNLFDITVEDVYGVNNLRDFLGEIVINLNAKTSIAVITSGNTLLLHTRDYELCQQIQNNIRISVRSFLNDNVTVELGQLITKTTRNIIELSLKGESIASIQVGRNFSGFAFENCTYVTHVNNGLVFQRVDVVRNHADYLDFDKNNQTFFNPGSPLICHNRLYGMATDENLATINFDSFYNYNTETRTAVFPTTEKVFNNSISGLQSDMLYLTLLSVLCIFYL